MDGTADLSELLVALVLASSVLLLPAAAATVAARPLWRHAPFLAPVYGVLALGSCGLLFFVWVLSPVAGAVGVWGVLAGSAVWLGIVGMRRADLTRLVRAGAPVAALTAGLLLGSTAYLLLWGGPSDLFALARVRFSHPLPIDNELPALLAGRLLEGSDPRTPVAGWLSSDRPPLQSGLLVMIQTATGWSGIPASTQAFAGGVVAQMAWAPAAYAAARSMGFTRWSCLAGVLFTGLSGSLLLNTVFTWPKLLSAGFVLAAIALAVDLRKRAPHPLASVVTMAAVMVLGLLSHGAALFALPVVAILLWRARRNVTWPAVAVSGVAAAIIYAPWLVYQRVYDPPGDRLLKWHLAGVIEPDEREFLETLRTAYSELSFSSLVQYKLENLARPFSVAPWELSATPGRSPDLRATQFVTLSGAIGLAWIPLVLLVGWVIIARRRRRSSPAATDACVALAATLAGIVIWSLVLFGPGTTYVHHGSHVPIILASCLPVAWLGDRSRWAVTVLGGIQIGALGIVYSATGWPGPLNEAALVATGIGVALCLVALLPPRGARPSEPAVVEEEQDRPDGAQAEHPSPPDATVPIGHVRPRFGVQTTSRR